MAKKAKIPDPLSEIAANLVVALEAHASTQSQTSETPFLTWSQLVASQSGVSMEWATAALLKGPAKDQIVVAVVDDLKSPVSLLRDCDRLAQDPAVLQRLAQHPMTGCSETVPVRSLAELCRSLEKSLRKQVESYWSGNLERLPLGLSAVQKRNGTKTLPGIHDGRFVRLDVNLSRKLVSSLEALKKSGDGAYPALLHELLGKADVKADDPLLSAAFEQAPFVDSTTIVAGKLPNPWMAFRADAEQSVNSEGFLRRLLQSQCSEAAPECRLSNLSKLLSKDLQIHFMEVWRTHFDMQRKFAFVDLGAAETKTKSDLLLRDSRFPRAEKLLADQLVKLLEDQKALGGPSYPLTLVQLASLLKSAPDTTTLQKATTVEPFLTHVILAFPGIPNSPLALADDAVELAASGSVLEFALSQTVTQDMQAVPVEKLSTIRGLHPLLKQHFAAAIDSFLNKQQLPVGIGAMRFGKKWHLFRMKDVTSGIVNSPVEELKPKSRKVSSGAALASAVAKTTEEPQIVN